VPQKGGSIGGAWVGVVGVEGRRGLSRREGDAGMVLVAMGVAWK
jgi:hypothetical protein